MWRTRITLIPIIMKKLLLLMILFPLWVSGQTFKTITIDPPPAVVNGKSVDPPPVTVGYLEYLPVNYDTAIQYPCIIFLHGSGERGLGTETDIQKVKKAGLPKNLSKNLSFIVICPQTNKWSWKGDVIPFVKEVLQVSMSIDQDRVYLTGLSMGGEGTWQAASDPLNSPNLFAAIAPICGRANREEGKTVGTRQIPTWAFHGDRDTAIEIEGDINPILGYRSVNKALRITVYEDIGHNCWDRAYRWDHTYHKQNIYEWFISKKLH